MAIHNKEYGLQSVLNAGLGEYHAKGFRLMELDDHFLSLYYKDERIGVLSQGGTTIPTIRGACHDHLVSLGPEAS